MQENSVLSLNQFLKILSSEVVSTQLTLLDQSLTLMVWETLRYKSSFCFKEVDTILQAAEGEWKILTKIHF